MEMWTNQSNKAALQAWVKETGIQLVQVNGQRKYGGPPPGWTGNAPPPPGSEVFIGKIPQDIYEDKLIPLFKSVGVLYEFRLMMTFSGLNRGFAYAKYTNRRSAQRAIATLNNFEIQVGYLIQVCRSTDKCELCIDGLAPSVQQCQLLPMLQELTTGVLDISLHPSPFRKQRQLAQVKYISHQAAAMAKKALVEGSLCLCGDQVEVDWLKPNTKQELQNSPVQAFPKIFPSGPDRKTLSQGLCGPEDCCMPPGVGTVLDYLNMQCEERQLGTPVFLTKCIQKNPEGWLRFWYQVVIPKYPSPFSGFIWLKPSHSGLEDHEMAKNAVALQLLKALGCPVV
ncbi:dead end protein homolog 1 [Hemicordylus capensis]|uniref:dead end protein homolog 1 n=1 Tax=Hemicordylus capensis TaxID=884348 RepID=UPI002304BDFA|nr:dead end protein homolog 1 [Hemicordylus capensis]